MHPVYDRRRVLSGLLVVAGLGIVLGLTACGQAQDAAPEVEAKLTTFRLGDLPFYDYTRFQYTYARAFALPRTNLEPAPTSYVLFQQARPTKPVDHLTPDVLESLQRQADDQRQRVEAYCHQHYRQFGQVTELLEDDPFANYVTFYWPLTGEESEVRAILETDDLDVLCTALADRYDYGRAQALLASLDGGRYQDSLGPVMVLDLGFDAVVVPFDEVTTANMERVPHIWKQAIDTTLKKARKTRNEALAELSGLDREISELERRAQDPGVKKKARVSAAQASRQKKDRRRGLWRRIFGKNSWGRAILCGFSGAVLKLAGAVILDTDPLEAKAEAWCKASGPKQPASG